MKHGLFIDQSLTQAGQGAAAGSGDGARYFGSGDLWPNSDYDTVFVFTVTWSDPPSVKFEVRSQDLGPLDDD